MKINGTIQIKASDGKYYGMHNGRVIFKSNYKLDAVKKAKDIADGYVISGELSRKDYMPDEETVYDQIGQIKYSRAVRRAASIKAYKDMHSPTRRYFYG